MTTLTTPRLHLLTLLALVVPLTACDSGTEPGQDAAVSLSVVAPVPAADANVEGNEVTYVDGGHELTLSRVALVLRKVEMKRSSDDECSTEGEADDEMSGEDDGCEEFEAGPYLLELPLDGSIETVVQVTAPPATYSELEFKIHAPATGAGDGGFLAQYPDFEGVSIRVEGTWDGEPFVFLQDLSEEQERALEPPLVVSEGEGPVNVTLALDVATWFRHADQSLLDPRTAGPEGVNEALVASNIRSSFRAFDDEDRNGEGDD